MAKQESIALDLTLDLVLNDDNEWIMAKSQEGVTCLSHSHF